MVYLWFFQWFLEGLFSWFLQLCLWFLLTTAVSIKFPIIIIYDTWCCWTDDRLTQCYIISLIISHRPHIHLSTGSADSKHLPSAIAQGSRPIFMAIVASYKEKAWKLILNRTITVKNGILTSLPINIEIEVRRHARICETHQSQFFYDSFFTFWFTLRSNRRSLQ